MVKFTSKGWMKWVERFVREAGEARLFSAVTVGPDGPTFTEVSRSVYSPAKLIGASWQTTVRGSIVSATYPELVWRFTQPTHVAGCYVVDAAGDVLWWEKYPTMSDGKIVIDIEHVELVIEIDTEG